MADAEDLKSSGDFSSCGFDSHPGHHYRVARALRARADAKRQGSRMNPPRFSDGVKGSIL